MSETFEQTQSYMDQLELFDTFILYARRVSNKIRLGASERAHKQPMSLGLRAKEDLPPKL
jgi:hypothetical protein